MPRAKRQPKQSKVPGTSFELMVKKVQQMMDPNTTVTHNEWLVDRLGNKRQYDVVIRGTFGGRPILGVIECKDHKHRKGPDTIEAFAKKTEHVQANVRIVVSRKGFTDQALTLAKHEGIGCLSLLRNDPNQAGFRLRETWYGVIKHWRNYVLTTHSFEPLPSSGYQLHEIKYDGRPVINWFFRKLVNQYTEENQEGQHQIVKSFTVPRKIEICGTKYLVEGFTLNVSRKFEYKQKVVFLTGEAFYDWQTNQLIIPAGGSIVGSAFESDLSLWPDYDGDVPIEETPVGIFQMIAYQEAVEWNSANDGDVPDLDTL